MEKVKNNKLINGSKSSFQIKKNFNSNINNNENIITNFMSNHLVKRQQNDDILIKSERPKNDEEDINSIESKLTELKLNNETFTRENIISEREFNIPEKKITDELIILSKDKLEKEKKQKEYEKQLKNDMEIHKKNMEKDEEIIKSIYQKKRKNNQTVNIILILMIIIIFSLIISLIYLLLKD